MQKTIVYNLLGTTLDRRYGSKRWEEWRPSVAICQQEDLLVHEYHLIYPSNFEKLKDLVCDDVSKVSPETSVFSYSLDFENPWDFEEVYSGLLDFLKQFSFSMENNEYLFHITTGTHVAQICIFLLTESRFFPGKLLQTSPLKNDKNGTGTYTIIDLDLSKYDRIASRFASQTKDDISFLKSGIETRNRAFNALIEQIEKVALRTTDPILLTGPTGAGKSNLASRIYELKKLKSLVNGSFIEVNCATLNGEQAISTLFGHKKGAFTGAVFERQGLLKAADKGMLFLDEIGELGLDEQAMLLRAIEEKKFMSLGADKETSSDFQLICGTNRDLLQEVKNGRFREDLLSRINLWTFLIPGLRQRLEDIEPNIEFELIRYAKKTGNIVRFNKEAKIKFLSFATSFEAEWKANFRDLNNAIVRMCTLSSEGRITDEDVSLEIERLKNGWGENEYNPLICCKMSKEQWEQLDLFEQIQLKGILDIARKSGSLADAGRKLFSKTREDKKRRNDSDRLRKYLAKYNLSWASITS